MKETVWHFAAIKDGKPIMRDGTEIVIGKEYKLPRAVMCECGYHGSREPLDALKYAPGLWVSRRELWGSGEDGDDKIVRTHCRHVIGADARDVILLWAADVAEHTWKKYGTDDPRPQAAIDAVRKYVANEITTNELSAAAYAAAGFSARSAAHAVADAAADVAACSAAYANAYVAAYAASNRLLRIRLNRLLKEAGE